MSKSLGEKRVRADFKVSSSGLIDDFKRWSGSMINLCEAAKETSRTNYELTDPDKFKEEERLWNLAQTAYEEAAMWAVKAATI